MSVGEVATGRRSDETVEDAARLFAGPGEMRARCRALDWAATPLGPVGGWPQSLRTSVALCLASGFPMLVMWGPELVQIYNDAFRSVLQAKHPAGLGQRARDCWPELWAMIGPMYQGVLETGESIFLEDQLFTPERRGEPGVVEEAYFTFSYSAIPDEAHRPAGILATVFETTRHVQSRGERERALERANADLRAAAAERERLLGGSEAARARSEAVLASIADAFYLLDHDWRFTYVNDAAEPLLQTTRERLLGRTLWEAFPGVAGSVFEGPYREAMATGRVTLAEAYFEPLGTWFDVRTYPWSGGLMVHFRDVGSRKAAEAERERLLRALDVERSRLAAVFAQTPSVLAIVRGPEHVLVMANEAYLALNGHRDVIGKPLLVALPELRGQGFEQRLDRVVETGEPHVGREVPIWLSTSAGAAPEERFFDFVYLPLVEPDADGVPRRVGVIAHGNDITEQVRARREVERGRARADRLQALTAALAATATPEEVAHVVVAQGVEATQAASGMLALRVVPPGPDGPGEGMLLRHQGLSPAIVAAYARFPLSRRGPIAECLRTGEVVFVHEGAALRARFPGVVHLFDELGTQAVATVPLAVAGDVVGAMSFSWTAPRVLSEADRELFLGFGRQAAQALERARLLEAERAARAAAEAAAARATLLQDLTAALSHSLTREQVAGVVIERVAAAFGANLGVLALVTPERDRLAVSAADRLSEMTWREWATFPLDAPVPLAQAARTGRPVVLPTFDDIAARAPGIAALCREYHTEALWALPVVAVDGEVLGAIGLSFRSPRGSGDGDGLAELGLLETLAGQAAQALERTRLFEAERAARGEAEQARAEAEAANRAKSEFLAVMSHELRTPLNAIGGYAELIELGIHGPVTDAQRAALARIQSSQRHLLGLIAGVLDYSRVEAGAVTYRLVDVPVTEAVAEAETLVAPQLRAKGLGYAWSGATPELRVRADREKLQQILLNLLGNAIKFTQPRDGVPGRIEVACTVDDGAGGSGSGMVHLHVRDTGMGIAPEQLERVFEPFVQADQRLTRPQEGVGLGLAISRDLARGMGGDLTAESVPGVGSTFSLTLPRA